MFEIYEVPNDELDGTEELIEWLEDKTMALEFGRSHRTVANCSVWVVQANDNSGYQKVIAT